MHGKELNFEAILELKGLGGASHNDEHVFSKNQYFVCFSIIYLVNNSRYKILKIVEIGIGLIPCSSMT